MLRNCTGRNIRNTLMFVIIEIFPSGTCREMMKINDTFMSL